MLEYEAVSLAAGIDVRRFSWIRPLAGDYADNYSNVATLYAGDPNSPEAWRAAIARAQQHGRNCSEVAAIVGAQQDRRAAPAEARAAASLLQRSRHGRCRHRSTGRRIRRSAVHASEGDHRHSARAPRLG